MRRLVAAAMLAVVAGCAGSPTASPSMAVYALPAVSDAGGACAGIGVEGATLTGDPTDPRVAWLASPYGRHDVVFPSGFRARFRPRLEVLNANGDVVAREGTAVTGGCLAGPGPNGLLLILSP